MLVEETTALGMLIPMAASRENQDSVLSELQKEADVADSEIQASKQEQAAEGEAK